VANPLAKFEVYIFNRFRDMMEGVRTF